MTLRRWLFLSGILLICAGIYWGYGRSYGGYLHPTPSVARATAIPVTVVTAKVTNYAVILSGLGTAQAYNTVTARTRVDGEVMKVFFREGQLAKQGDLLAQIDPRPYQAAVDQAAAKKAQDEALLHNSQLDLQRYSTLAKQDFASRQQLDTQNASVAQNTAMVQADLAALENAQTQLDYTNIRAPISGRIGFRLIDQGNIVNAASQTGIVTITQVQPITVIFALPEGRLSDVNAAMKKGSVRASVYTVDGTRMLAQGNLEVVNNQVDPATGTIQIKATFENLDDSLWPGLGVTVRLPIQTLQDVIVLPQTAIQRSQQGLSVYVVDDKQKARLQTVEIGASDNDRAVIIKGVSAGERVVISGQYRLQNGALVAVGEADDMNRRPQR